MAEITVGIEIADLPKVKEIVAEFAFVLKHGRPWQEPDESMVGEKFIMWTNHGTLLIGPLSKDFLKTGFVVAVQPYPTSPSKQAEAREALK
jgi:hypothetical protein